ncbi:hypothetical protein M514_12133 [Trichuris suis]|uniref:Secreted protein n=1 Tax=Trichuris suis TaxID=68888 RepID=A0A085MXC7_9BILA|nr:hypothetical protein M514_12133 [Trichuris suis]
MPPSMRFLSNGQARTLLFFFFFFRTQTEEEVVNSHHPAISCVAKSVVCSDFCTLANNGRIFKKVGPHSMHNEAKSCTASLQTDIYFLRLTLIIPPSQLSTLNVAHGKSSALSCRPQSQPICQMTTLLFDCKFNIGGSTCHRRYVVVNVCIFA